MKYDEGIERGFIQHPTLEGAWLEKKEYKSGKIERVLWVKWICDKCGKNCWVRKNSKTKSGKHFCDIKCFNKTNKEHSEETKKKIGEGNKGKIRTNEFKSWLSETNSGENHPQWRGGKSHEPYTTLFNKKEFKQYIRDRDNNTCQNPNCGGNSNKLVIHHIDYDKQNDDERNLITICNTCNSRANFGREFHYRCYIFITDGALVRKVLESL